MDRAEIVLSGSISVVENELGGFFDGHSVFDSEGGGHFGLYGARFDGDDFDTFFGKAVAEGFHVSVHERF